MLRYQCSGICGSHAWSIGASTTFARYTGPPASTDNTAPAATGTATRRTSAIERRQSATYAHVAAKSATSDCLKHHAARKPTPAAASQPRGAPAKVRAAQAMASVDNAVAGMSGRMENIHHPGSAQPIHVTIASSARRCLGGDAAANIRRDARYCATAPAAAQASVTKRDATIMPPSNAPSIFVTAAYAS
jgi:hypothetical protein